MTHEEAIAIAAEAAEPIAFAEYVTSDWYSKRAKERSAVAITAYLEARGAVLCDAEPVAWKHQAREPDKQDNTLYSSSPDNPWSHWLKDYMHSCFYSATPLHAALSDNPKGASDAL